MTPCMLCISQRLMLIHRFFISQHYWLHTQLGGRRCLATLNLFVDCKFCMVGDTNIISYNFMFGVCLTFAYVINKTICVSYVCFLFSFFGRSQALCYYIAHFNHCYFICCLQHKTPLYSSLRDLCLRTPATLSSFGTLSLQEYLPFPHFVVDIIRFLAL